MKRTVIVGMGQLAIVVWLVAAHSAPRLSAAERIELREQATDTQIRKVAVELTVSGKLFPEPGPDKALKLAVDAHFDYSERRLAGTGREALSLRSIRHYNRARATIEAGEQLSNVGLRKSERLVVAAGQAEGLDLFSPSGPLTYGELELLRIPCDSLAMLALLPETAVEAGETWKGPDWALPLLTGVESVEKGALTCKLESIQGGEATVHFSGNAGGATTGAAASVNFEGRLVFDRAQRCISRLEMTQSEKRAIGAVSPGLNVAAKLVLTREAVAEPKRLTDPDLADLPLEPNAASRLLLFDSPAWNVQFYYDRRWHLFQQTSELALLRLLDKEGLIAQCNIKKLPDVEPGKHVSQEQFQADIERTLGKNFQEFVQTEKLKLKDGLFVVRVVVAGTVERKNDKQEMKLAPMQWIYYLAANGEGRQIAFVFSVDPRQVEALDGRDLAIVGGLQFLAPRPLPTPAVKPAAKK